MYIYGHYNEKEVNALTMRREGCILPVKKGRVECPICHRLTNVKVGDDTQARSLPAFCAKCGWDGEVNIDNGVCYIGSPGR